MPESDWLRKASPAFQLMIASSWLAPDSHRDIQDKTVQQACDAGPDWTEYLNLIDRHRTPATSWAVLKRTPNVGVPEHVRRELQRRSDLCRRQAMLQLRLLAEVLKSLNQSNIPVMPLKGPLLSAGLYGDAGLRQSKDLDILVPQQYFCRAQECIQNLGWRLGADYFPLSPRQWEATFIHECHVGYAHPPQGCQLELHWRLSLAQNTEQHWARSRKAKLSGSSYQAMGPVDLAIYLARHGAAHEWFRAKWLGDLARLHCNGQVDWLSVLEEARTVGQERPLLLGLQLLSKCHDLAFPDVARSLRTRLPYPLIIRAVRSLTDRNEPVERKVWDRFKKRIQTYGYQQTLWPHRFWWSDLTHRRLDFKVVRLPDSFFWLYVPLRLLLWLQRMAGNKQSHSTPIVK